MFKTDKQDLRAILRDADEGKLQLPDFQRDYVWSDYDVRSLIASVAKGFPVGALLTLETGGPVRFEPRVLEGVQPNGRAPDELLLDGQQRITSLYQAAFSKSPVRTRNVRGMEVERYYYIDIKKAVESGVDIEEAIIGVPEDRIMRSNFPGTGDVNLSTREAEFENDMFPLNQVFDRNDWIYTWKDYWTRKESGRGDLLALDDKFFRNVVEHIDRYEMPIIRLDRTNGRQAICLVFEKVNVGGKKLDAFELLTAMYAADKYKLREDWKGPPGKPAEGRSFRMVERPIRLDVLAKVANTDFLQACTLLHSRDLRLAKAAQGLTGMELPKISCTRGALLELPLDAYKTHSPSVETGFRDAGAFLNEQKIIWQKDVPYPPQIVGIACTYAILGREARTVAAKQKLAQWFWSVILGELYGSSTESRLARDVPELVEWISGRGARPGSLDEAIFQQDRLNSLRTRNSAAYKGIHALLMDRGCRDFITGRPTDIMTFFNDRIDIHHIFPKAWCQKQGIPAGDYDSIINKTPLFYATNIFISGDAPSIYLKRIQDEHGIVEKDLDDFLRSHLIEPKFIRADDFYRSFEARKKALSALVANAMNKSVIEKLSNPEPESEPVSDADDELLESS